MEVQGRSSSSRLQYKSSRTATSGPRVSRSALRQPARRARVSSSAALDSSQLIIGHTVPQQYFPVSDLHTACFHEPTSPNDRLWKVFDRIWGLQINAGLARRGAGRCVLLVAFDPTKAPQHTIQASLAAAAEEGAAAAAADARRRGIPPPTSITSSSSSSTSSSSNSNSSSSSNGFAGDIQLPEEFAFPQYGYWLSRLVDRPVWPGLGATHTDLGIVGVAQVDTFGDIIPPRTLSAQRDGAVGWVPREGYAYISNVAVSAAVRRRSVAQRLMAEAEGLAASWGCDKAGLHVNPSNTPALALYRSLSYKKGVLEAPWMPYLQGRAPDRCLLMLKSLKQQQLQQQQAKQQQQQQDLGQLVAGSPAAQGLA